MQERQSPAAPPDDPQVWLSIADYARAYNVTRNTVYKWLDAGLLEFFRAGAVVRIKKQPPRNPAAC